MNHQRTAWVAAIALLMSGCGLMSRPPAEVIPPPVEPPPEDISLSPPSTDEESPPEPEEEQAEEVPNNVQIYHDDNDMFALALPEGYSNEPTDQGMTFLSADEGFAGEVLYQTTDDPSTDLYDMEEQLKAIVEPKFTDIEWQRSAQRQPDGSVRLAWVAKNEAGQDIDALSFLEKHGQTTFVLMLYAIDKVYNEYKEDARVIVGTYVVRQGPGTEPDTATAEE